MTNRLLLLVISLNLAYAQAPPSGDNSTVTTFEDTPYTFSVNDFPFSDEDGDTFAGIKIASLETTGDLEYNGVDVSINTIAEDITLLTFTPDSNANGIPNSKFNFFVHDSSGDSSLSSYIMGINVTPVNDAPIMDTIADTLTNEDTPLTIDISGSDVDTGTGLGDENVLTFSATSSNTNITVIVNNFSDQLTITPDENWFGEATIIVIVNDIFDGSGLSDSTEFILTVNPMNDAPVMNGISAHTNEDIPLTIGISGSDLDT